MLDPEEATKSYFDLMAEHKDKTKECCDKAKEDVKEALQTISFGSSKIKDLLAKLDKEEEAKKDE